MADQTDIGPARPEPRTGDRAAAAAAHAACRREHRPRRRSGSELPILLLVAFGLAFLVKTFVVQAFYIPSGSMEQTLQVGDRVLVNKVVYKTRDIAARRRRGVQRRRLVHPRGADRASRADPCATVVDWFGRTFGFAPPDERDFVKRVIGVGGDHVRVLRRAGPDHRQRRAARGDVVPLSRATRRATTRFDVVVPAGKLWVMGDHRAASSDSRAHLGDPGGGFVPDRPCHRARLRRGLAVLRLPQVLEIPDTFDDRRQHRSGP